MSTKKIVLVIIISLLIGFILLGFILFKLTDNNFSYVEQNVISDNLIAQPPSPTPKPTLPPIDQNSNLEEEIKNLSPTDYSEDFSKLRQETSQF